MSEAKNTLPKNNTSPTFFYIYKEFSKLLFLLQALRNQVYKLHQTNMHICG